MGNGNGERIEVGVGRWRVGLAGPNTMLIALIVLLFVGFTLVNLNALHEMDDDMDKAHGHMIGLLDRILEEARLIAYLTSVPEKDRPRVILPKPLMERIKPEYRPDVRPDAHDSRWGGIY